MRNAPRRVKPGGRAEALTPQKQLNGLIEKLDF